jgi:hypothetical protein
VEQLLYLCSYSWIHPLYESQNNKPDLLFNGNIRIVLFCLLDSTLAITSWHTITTSYYSTLHSLPLFWFTKNKKWIYNFALFNLLLSGVLIYDDEQGSFINCVASNYYEWFSLGEDRPKKQKKTPIII